VQWALTRLTDSELGRFIVKYYFSWNVLSVRNMFDLTSILSKPLFRMKDL
jgi:hypothetical protein